MSDTPRTDDTGFYLDVNGRRFHEPKFMATSVPIHFARKLERENAKLRTALEDIQTLSQADANYQLRMGSIAYRALKS